MDDITDINEYRKNKKLLIVSSNNEQKLIDLKDITYNEKSYKSCQTCIHYTLTKYNENRCMMFPLGSFHHITTEHCSPVTDKVYWYPKSNRKGLLTRLKEFLF